MSCSLPRIASTEHATAEANQHIIPFLHTQSTCPANSFLVHLTSLNRNIPPLPKSPSFYPSDVISHDVAVCIRYTLMPKTCTCLQFIPSFRFTRFLFFRTCQGFKRQTRRCNGSSCSLHYYHSHTRIAGKETLQRCRFVKVQGFQSVIHSPPPPPLPFYMFKQYLCLIPKSLWT